MYGYVIYKNQIMNTFSFKKKALAALTHLAGSIVVVLLLMGIIYTIWFPNNLIYVTDTNKILAIIILVDISIGPFLTFIIYNEQKKELKRDILIILLIQISALVYGVHVISNSRPAYIVFAIDRFEITYISQLSKAELNKTKTLPFNKKPKPWERPTWISAELPSDPAERSELLFQAIDGRDLAQTPKYFRPLENANELIKKKAQPINPSQEKACIKNEKCLEENNNLAAIPLIGKSNDYSVIIDVTNLNNRTILDIPPW